MSIQQLGVLCPHSTKGAFVIFEEAIASFLFHVVNVTLESLNYEVPLPEKCLYYLWLNPCNTRGFKKFGYYVNL